MATTFSTTSTPGYRDSVKSLTVQALQERAKQAALAQASAAKMTTPVTSPMQGAGYLANILGAQLQSAQADQADINARDRIAAIKSGIDWQKGPSADQYASWSSLDPEGADKFMKDYVDYQHEMSKQQEQEGWQGGQNEAQRQAEAARSAAGITSAEKIAAGTQAGETARTQAQIAAHTADIGTQAAATQAVDTSRIGTQEAANVKQAGDLVQQRTADAAAKGMKPEDPATQRYILTGEFPPVLKPSEQQGPGLAASNQELAKEEISYNQRGGPAASSALKNLTFAMAKMKDNPDLTGLVGLIPEAYKPLMAGDTKAAKDAVRSAISGTLTATLGAQFSQLEGENLMNRAFDDRLPVKENMRRVQILIDQYSNVAKQQEDMFAYWRKNGRNIEGYTPPKLPLDPQALLKQWDAEDANLGGAPGGGSTLTPDDLSTQEGIDAARKRLNARKPGG